MYLLPVRDDDVHLLEEDGEEEEAEELAWIIWLCLTLACLAKIAGRPELRFELALRQF